MKPNLQTYSRLSMLAGKLTSVESRVIVKLLALRVLEFCRHLELVPENDRTPASMKLAKIAFPTNSSIQMVLDTMERNVWL